VEVGQRGIAVRSLGGSRAGEMRITRFLRNDKVSLAEIVAQACARTAGRVRGLHVLAIQDTTVVREEGRSRSLQAHATIAVDAETGAVLGLVHADFFARQGGVRDRRKQRGFEEKASRRWLEGARAAAPLRAAGALEVTVIADREGDIYELFALRPAGTQLLVRAAQERALVEGGVSLARLADQPEAGRMCVQVPAAPGRKARTALIALRFCAAEIRRPHGRGRRSGLPDSVRLHLVEAREIDPPDGEAGLLWRSITTHQPRSFEDARLLTGLYRRRWAIEELFRVLKTRGFDIERVTVAEAPFETLCAAALVAAVSVLQLVAGRDGRLKRPLDDLFEPHERGALEAVCRTLEGNTARQKNPHPPDTLAYAAWVCARLGGWTGYNGKPGPVVMLRGLHQFRAIQNGWSIAHDV
jgi:hypothetical protein